MMQGAYAIVGPGIRKFKMLYSFAIGANMIIAIGHIGYAFVEYDNLNEPALWFFSAALAIIFNAGLNILCLSEYRRLTHIIAMIANLALLIFSVVLAIVITEIQTVCFAVVVLYTVVVCYSHNKRMRQKPI